MPYPNIFALHHLSEDQRTVTLAGPLQDWYELDTHPTTVFAFVSQVPTAERATPTELKAGEPTHTATARGHADYGPDVHNWIVDVATIGETSFEEGWAFVSAAAVNFTSTGQLQTYTWSRWAYLTFDELDVGTLSP